MTNLVEITSTGLPVTTTLLIAEAAHCAHAIVLGLVRRHIQFLQELGTVWFGVPPGKEASEEFAMLNERHAMYVLSCMRNTAEVDQVRKDLLRRFYEMAGEGQKVAASARVRRDKTKTPAVQVRTGVEQFYLEWREGLLEAPYMSCITTDLYEVYERWCKREGEQAVTQTMFSLVISRKEVKSKERSLGSEKGRARQNQFFVIGDRAPGMNRQEWLGECVAAFRAAAGLVEK
ncbi:probable phage protein [Hahella chejuensis KCTC 2396]|uniref:Probable phage protein n=1 Tax=Hahella chejuensis (strain KCTC 2396) TaxID=349521 RepID=Q2SI64_HAHCH|nr:phage protein [Hahella chejuensis]ABC29660.1 probable phage protein [Hahella chejuensis KCTC 2396]